MLGLARGLLAYDVRFRTGSNVSLFFLRFTKQLEKIFLKLPEVRSFMWCRFIDNLIPVTINGSFLVKHVAWSINRERELRTLLVNLMYCSTCPEA